MDKPRTRGGYLSELTVIIKGIIRNITRKEMRFAKFPFYCPGCGDLSTPLKRGEGPQADTVFFCNRCKNSPAASKPANPATPSIKPSSHNTTSSPAEKSLMVKCANAHCSTQIYRYTGGHFHRIHDVILCGPCLDKFYEELDRKNSFWGKLFG